MTDTPQTQGKKTPKLRVGEKKFARKYIENNGNGSKTVKEVFGITHDGYARVKAHDLLTNPNVQQEIAKVQLTLKEALEKEGITPEYLAKKVNVLLTATDKDGNQDFTAVDKGLKHATNIYGIEDVGEKQKSSNTTYNFIFSPEVQENIKHMEVKIKEQLLQKLNKPHDS